MRVAPLIAAASLMTDAAVAEAPEPIADVRSLYDGALTPDAEVATLRNIDRLFPTRTVPASDHPRPLLPAARPLGPVRFTYEGKRYDLYDYLALDRVAGMLVLRDGQVAFETYQYGNTPATRWASMSIAKSITSTLIGAAVKDGLIGSLDDRVTKYVPRLDGSAYEGVSIRDVLMMASGVKWNEKYTDPHSDRRHLLDAQIAQKRGAVMDVMAGLGRAAAPGTLYTYSTGETQVAGEVLHGAIGRPLADYLAEKIWRPWGMEADARWWLDSPDGVEIAGSGLAVTLRDYARFGAFVLEGGVIDGKPVLPEGWIAEATTPKRLQGGEAIDYGYLWWTATTEASRANGVYAAVGIFGQSIYIDPKARVVVATISAEPKPQDMEPIDPEVFFNAVVEALK